MTTEIEFSDIETRNIKYFLGLRYGNRKGIKLLMKLAIRETVGNEARKQLQEQ